MQHVDGVMIGREIYNSPYMLAEADQQIYQQKQPVPAGGRQLGPHSRFEW
ncbi:MAG: tRNA-dihydrouridine synthase [Kordiimonadaceae bacterium]|nr:tRNA-dihydrouridine synthase [Kordiimonadaceae bacterium]